MGAATRHFAINGGRWQGWFKMANQNIDTGSAIRIPFRGRQNVGQFYRAAEARVAHRITDRRLIRKVRAANGLLKRAFDFALAAAALVFLAPLFLSVIAAVRLTDRGPIFYRHTRVGRQGARFECLKFRTMAVDAEERLSHILQSDPHAAAEWQNGQKLKNDPRITAIGTFLRKTSIDELPQLWNVLRGDMSVIGPRPITRAELNRYGKDRRFYLLVRPGITGLWQVSGRSSTGYEKRIRCDREYLEEWSWLGEFWILLMTIPAILNTDDAC
jgi:exopolysaccharide production protein ExoY